MAEVRAALKGARADGITLLDIDGGEPLLYPSLVTVIRDARRLGFERITVTTNGRRLADPDVAAALLASGLHSLLISLHGSAPTIHDGLTDRPGSFRETATGLRNVLRLMAPGFGLGVNTTVTTANLADLMKLGERLAALAVPQWNLQLVTPFGRAGEDLLPTREELRDTLSAVLERFGERLAMAVVNAPPCRLPGYERYVAADLGKLQRTMRFVTREEVNLAHYLQQRRRYEEKCEDCLFRPACGGEYE